MKRLIAKNKRNKVASNETDIARMVSVLDNIDRKFSQYAEGNFNDVSSTAELMSNITSGDVPDNAFKNDFVGAFEKAKSIVERGKALKEEAAEFKRELAAILVKGEKMSSSVKEVEWEPDDKFIDFLS